MNSIITLPKLTELLAEAASVDRQTALTFVSDFTSMIGQALKTDGSVSIKGIGTFNTVFNDDKVKVAFTPDKSITDTINAPFLFFEPVQLAEGISDKSFANVDNNSKKTDEDKPSQQTESSTPDNMLSDDSDKIAPDNDQHSISADTDDSTDDSSDKDDTDNSSHDDIHDISQDDKECQSIEAKVSDEKDEDTVLITSESTDRTTDEDDEDDEDESMRLPWFTISLFFIVGLLIGLGLGYFGHDYIQGRAAHNITNTETAKNIIPTDTVNEDDSVEVDLSDATEGIVEQKKVSSTSATDSNNTSSSETKTNTSAATADAQAVYDEIKPGSGLSALALKHYGNSDYWVYIYEANKDKIKNPNNVMAGIRLVIPPKSKCDISDDPAKNIQAAKAKAAQIQKQF